MKRIKLPTPTKIQNLTLTKETIRVLPADQLLDVNGAGKVTHGKACLPYTC